jgi:V8-like Glu-specific endopeptidase
MRAVSVILSLVIGVAMLLTSCARPARKVAPDPRVGAIFRDGSDRHGCSGSVVHSTGGDLVLTAAHCLLGDSPTTFVPGFAGALVPAETWKVVEVYFDARWITSRAPRADYAIARVRGTGTRSVEDRAGAALSLSSAPVPGSRVTVTGYAAGVGGQPISCQGSTGATGGGFPSLPCDGLVGGTSGAPWIIGSTVVGVIGGLQGGGCTENLSYSPPFDERTAQLLIRAEAGGPGDTSPTGYNDGC